MKEKPADQPEESKMQVDEKVKGSSAVFTNVKKQPKSKLDPASIEESAGKVSTTVEGGLAKLIFGKGDPEADEKDAAVENAETDGTKSKKLGDVKEEKEVDVEEITLEMKDDTKKEVEQQPVSMQI